MSPLLIRCTVHRDLSHDAFADWLDRRRPELTSGPGGVRHVNAARLGAATWVLELHANRPDDAGFRTAASHLLADLCLLGMRPDVYVPAPWALAGVEAETVPLEHAPAPYAGSA